MSGRSKIDTKVLNSEQRLAFYTLDRYRLYPDIVQEYTDGSFRIRYGNPEINQVIYGTLLTDGVMIDINECEPRASRKESNFDVAKRILGYEDKPIGHPDEVTNQYKNDGS